MGGRGARWAWPGAWGVVMMLWFVGVGGAVEPMGGGAVAVGSVRWEPWVVHFRGTYRAQAEVREAVEVGLGAAGVGEDGWRWVERVNAASRLPTDFGRVEVRVSEGDEVGGDGGGAVVEALRGIEGATGVTRDAAVRRREVLGAGGGAGANADPGEAGRGGGVRGPRGEGV